MEVALQLTDNASLRGMEGHDGKWYFSVYDFINFVTGHEARHRYAQITFSRLVANGSEHAKEVTTNCCHFQFPGQGQKSTPCMTIRGLQRLLMILGGRVATEYREIVESVFTRYTAGDTSLIEEVRANAVSDAPEIVMARQALEHEPVEPVEPVMLGKRKDIDEMEYTERAAKVHELKLKNQENAIKNVQNFADVMGVLDPDWKEDTRLVRQMKDCMQNVLSTQPLITAGGGRQICDSRGDSRAESLAGLLAEPLSITEVARQLGLKRPEHGELTAIGKEVKKLYQQKHHCDPPQHKQCVDGQERLVNSYTEEDRDLLEDAVKQHVNKRKTRSCTNTQPITQFFHE